MNQTTLTEELNVDVCVELCGIKLKNPTMLASGILGGTGPTLKRVAEHGVGAIITKSIGVSPRAGYKGPTVIEPMENVLLNAMGLPNPGYKEFIRTELPVLEDCETPLIVNIFGENAERFVEVAGAMADAKVQMLELNISCPHSLEKNWMRKCKLIGQDKDYTANVVTQVRKEVKIPIIVKLSPNVTDIVEFAKVAVDNGADAISAINTIQALEIEPEFELPVLGNLVGGQSGASIRCIAQRKVADIVVAMARNEMQKVPVIGVGGILNGLDIVRFLLLGAHCVQIGTAVAYDGLDVFQKCINELSHFMDGKGYKKLSDFRGNTLSKCMLGELHN